MTHRNDSRRSRRIERKRQKRFAKLRNRRPEPPKQPPSEPPPPPSLTQMPGLPEPRVPSARILQLPAVIAATKEVYGLKLPLDNDALLMVYLDLVHARGGEAVAISLSSCDQVVLISTVDPSSCAGTEYAVDHRVKPAAAADLVRAFLHSQDEKRMWLSHGWNALFG